MMYLNEIYSAFSNSLVFLIKFAICYWIYKFSREKSNTMFIANNSRLKIYFEVFKGCIVASIVLATIQYFNNGYHCSSYDAFGCMGYDYVEYDDDFIPITFEQAVELFTTYVLTLLAITYFGVKQGIFDAKLNMLYKQDLNQTHINQKR